jgi:hypothetical protein
MDGSARRGLLEIMSYAALPRRCAALIAAYAIALQALLAAVAIPVGAAPAGVSGWELCTSVGTGSTDAPRTHEACSACLAGHCAPAAGTPPAALATPAWAAFAAVALPPPRPAALPAHASRNEAHAPRAPPLT